VLRHHERLTSPCASLPTRRVARCAAARSTAGERIGAYAILHAACERPKEMPGHAVCIDCTERKPHATVISAGVRANYGPFWDRAAAGAGTGVGAAVCPAATGAAQPRSAASCPSRARQRSSTRASRHVVQRAPTGSRGAGGGGHRTHGCAARHHGAIGQPLSEALAAQKALVFICERAVSPK
jgi:hypothetical protein